MARNASCLRVGLEDRCNELFPSHVHSVCQEGGMLRSRRAPSASSCRYLLQVAGRTICEALHAQQLSGFNTCRGHLRSLPEGTKGLGRTVPGMRCTPAQAACRRGSPQAPGLSRSCRNSPHCSTPVLVLNTRPFSSREGFIEVLQSCKACRALHFWGAQQRGVQRRETGPQTCQRG